MSTSDVGASDMSTSAGHRAGAVQIVADGRFGTAVAGHLAAWSTAGGDTAQVAHHPLGGDLPDFLGAGRVAVWASWREVRAELDAFAAAARTAARPWLPVVFAPPRIRVGPLFVPGTGPCPTCLRTRARQYSEPDGDLADQLEQALSQHPDLGAAGYPPHAAAIAAGLALGMLPAADGGRTASAEPGHTDQGLLAEIDYTTDTVRTWRLVPVHGCAGCHPAADREAAAKVRVDRLRAIARGRR